VLTVAARLHVQGLDFISFPNSRLSEIRKTLVHSKDKIAPARQSRRHPSRPDRQPSLPCPAKARISQSESPGTESDDYPKGDLKAAPLIEQAYAAGRVGMSYYGDWESAQITLGLKTERKAIRKERGFAAQSFMDDVDSAFAPIRAPFVNTTPKVSRTSQAPIPHPKSAQPRNIRPGPSQSNAIQICHPNLMRSLALLRER
jgi:hypothetical protein